MARQQTDGEGAHEKLWAKAGHRVELKNVWGGGGGELTPKSRGRRVEKMSKQKKQEKFRTGRGGEKIEGGGGGGN